MDNSTVLLWIGLFGVFCGFRALLPIAMLCYYAYSQQIPLPGHWVLLGHLPVFVTFAILAAGELVFDKWKKAPNRTAPLGLSARFVTAAFGGMALAASVYTTLWKAALVAAFCALFDAALGYSLRQYFREATRAPDLYIAVAEDIVTIAGCMWVLDHLA